MTVDHINGDKGNNSVENLQWMKREDNIKKAYDDGAYGNLSSLRRKYFTWKNSCVAITPENRPMFRNDIHNGMSLNDLALKYGISKTSINNVKWGMKHSEMEDLFQEAYTWERLLACLNSLRDLYLETKDIKIFQQIRCLLPQGYLQKSTFMFNYEVLANIYKSRKDHKLDEWREFCNWIRDLPYSELITGED